MGRGSQGEKHFLGYSMDDSFEGWGQTGGRRQLCGQGSFFSPCQCGHGPGPEQEGRDGSSIAEQSPTGL